MNYKFNLDNATFGLVFSRLIKITNIQEILKFMYSTKDKFSDVITEEAINEIETELLDLKTEYQIISTAITDNLVPEYMGHNKSNSWYISLSTTHANIMVDSDVPPVDMTKVVKNFTYNDVADHINILDSFVKPYDYPDKQAIDITLQVTEACTLACKYCYQHDKSPKRMTWDVAKTAIDRIFTDYKDTHYAIIVNFIGGEALLEPELVEKCIEYILLKSIELRHELPWYKLLRFSICSNGTEWDKPLVQHLMQRFNKLMAFTVSIDGNKELHDSARVHLDGVTGSYDEAIHAATEAKRVYGYDMGTKMTIAPSNLIFLYPALKHYLTSGSDTIHANCVYEEGWTLEHAKFYYDQLKKLADYKLENYPEVFLSLFHKDRYKPTPITENTTYCGGRGRMLAIDPDGKMYPCLRYAPTSVGRDKDHYITCGDIYNGVDNKVLDDLACNTRSVIEDDECFFCPIHAGCGECAAYSWEVTGRSDTKVKYICVMHKAEALANVYYWNKYYRQIGSPQRFKNYVPEDWALEIIDRDELAMLYELSGQANEE